MIRIRLAGILCFALLWGSSTMLAQSKAPATKAPPTKAVKLVPIDINSSSEDEMVTRGIDRAAAKKIIESRPFRNKKELVTKQLLTTDQYNRVKDMIVAKQPPKAKK